MQITKETDTKPVTEIVIALTIAEALSLHRFFTSVFDIEEAPSSLFWSFMEGLNKAIHLDK